jgi:hypothetical protein
MAAVGNYQVVSTTFSVSPTATAPASVTIDAPDGAVVLGAGIAFDSAAEGRFTPHSGSPAVDGSSWTFVVYADLSGGQAPPLTGTMYVTCAELGNC